MDRITENMLSEFSSEHSVSSLLESKRFEHFAAFSLIKSQHSETFDTLDLVVGDDSTGGTGSDTGIDAIGIIVNGRLVTDIDDLNEYDGASYLEVTFILIQSETSSHFDAAKIGTFGFGALDFFSDTPRLTRNLRVAGYAEIVREIYSKSVKFTRGNPVCKLYYVTTGKWFCELPLVARIDQAKSDLSGTDLFEKVEFEPVGKDDIQKLYRKTKNPIQATFMFSTKVTISPEIPGVSQAYIGYLAWPEFRKIILDDSGKLKGGLFFDNVRDFKGLIL